MWLHQAVSRSLICNNIRDLFQEEEEPVRWCNPMPDNSTSIPMRPSVIIRAVESEVVVVVLLVGVLWGPVPSQSMRAPTHSPV